MKSLNDEITETRKILGESYNTVPDESIAKILHIFSLLVKAILRSVKKESP